MKATPKRIDVSLKRFLSIRRTTADWDNTDSDVIIKTSAVIASHRLKSANETGKDSLTRPLC